MPDRRKNQSIEYICANDKGVEIPRYVIMLNHVHMIVALKTGNNIAANPTGHVAKHGRAWKPDPTDGGMRTRTIAVAVQSVQKHPTLSFAGRLGLF